MDSVTAIRRFLALVLAMPMLLAGGASAQSEEDLESLMPPRLGVVEGPVFFWRSGMGDWAQAQLNTALAAGDSLHTGDRGTAEIQVGARDYLRMTANTTVTLTAHQAGLMQFRVDAGTASFDLRGAADGKLIEIDTPQGAVMVGRAGYYRIDAGPGVTRLTVRHGGQATLVRQGSRNQYVGDGEEALIRDGEGGAMLVERRAAPPPDSWDRWNDARSDHAANAQSLRYVPAGVYGASDLDPYGAWREDRNYGWIWVPVVASGWTPYSTGRWQWDPVFGWTWVDAAPWGWVTCHHGRWVFVDGVWAWAPGPRHARPAYAPALVAFFHAGSTVSWVALGWGEPLIPWWGPPSFRGTVWWGGWGGPRIVNQRPHHAGAVDVTRIRFVHAAQSNAVITVHQEEFHRERFHGARLPPPQTRDWAPVRGEHPVKPVTIGGAARPAPQPVPRPEMQPFPRPGMPEVPRPEMQPFPRPAPRPMPEPAQQPPAIPPIQPAPRPVPQPAIQPAPQPSLQPIPQPAPAIVQPPAAPPISAPQAAPRAPEFPHPVRQRPLDPGERPFGRREALERPVPQPEAPLGPGGAFPRPFPGPMTAPGAEPFPRRDEPRWPRERDVRERDDRPRPDMRGEPRHFGPFPRGLGEPQGPILRPRE